jgi:hypothetical protein
MNERIRELWTKAAESTAAHPSGQNNSWETQVNFLDKFAKLIVRECAELCDNLQKWPSTEPRHCAEEIREHFGVEE